MKKIISASAIVLSAMCMQAEVTNMVFKTADGATHTIAATGLEITFADGQLQAANSNETLVLPLASLATMEFSDNQTSLADAAARIEGIVEITSVSGVSFGAYTSIIDAIGALPGGTYLVKKQSGETVKIFLRK